MNFLGTCSPFPTLQQISMCLCVCISMCLCVYLSLCLCVYISITHKRTHKKNTLYTLTHICKVSTALRSSIGALKTYIKISSKVTFSTIFLGHLMTSEAKDYFYKVEDNLVNYIHKKLCHYIWAGLCVKRFQSFEF